MIVIDSDIGIILKDIDDDTTIEIEIIDLFLKIMRFELKSKIEKEK